METTKHHYRKVFKSDHLGVADLEDLIEEGKVLVFTIKEVKQEMNVMVAGKKGNFNIAYFNEQIKPLVLNAGNSKIIKSFCFNSPFVEDWKNVPIELTIDQNVKFGKDVVSGVRIRPTQPKVKVKSIFVDANFKSAHEKGATIEMIKKVYEITPEMESKYLEYGKSNPKD
jgi:hypothetical protein